MAKQKLTPERRTLLRKELKANLAAGVEKSEILKSLSAKYGITSEGMRWYLNAASPNGSARRGKAARGKSRKKKPGRKGSRGARARKARGPRARAVHLPGVLGQLTEKALRGLLAAKRLVPALDASRQREEELRARVRDLNRELRAESGKARKIQRQIKRLARA
jgi:hypothetical protein